MARSRIIFFVIIGAAILLVLGVSVVGPTLKNLTDSQSKAATAQYERDNIVTIRVSYGTEKEEWFRDAIARFETANPTIKIDAVGEGSMEAYQGLSVINDQSTNVNVVGTGNEPIPAVWSPASQIQVNLLNAATQNSINRPLAISCKPLVLSPLVIMVWEDRAKVFETYYKDKGGITLANIGDALDPNGKIKGKWENLGGKPQWGLIKIGHTDPDRSNSGVMALVAMANNFYQRVDAIKVQDITDDKFQAWLANLEIAANKPFIHSTGDFVKDVIAKGPSSYDFVIAYEALAIENYQNAVGRQAQNIRITYPQFNLYSDHPMCLIDHPSITQAQRDAAQKFQAFLLTPDIQKLALTYGFRPSDLTIPVFNKNGEFDTGNPAYSPADLKTAGVGPDIGQELKIPDGDTIKQLLTVWRRNSGS